MPNYDLLVVGAGISAAALCAELKATHRILVLEARGHLGGNCYDYQSRETFIHRYGAHLFHTPDQELVSWTNKFTEWVPYHHAVTAEIMLEGHPKQVPFPYSQETQNALGRSLAPNEVVDLFFRGYSEKMWGQGWEALPPQIRNRIPKMNVERSDFFPGQFVALPKFGYTRMLENMFDGCDVVLGADPEAWYSFAAPEIPVVYCGRLDLLRDGKGGRIGGHTADHAKKLPGWLQHVSLEFDWFHGDHGAPTGVLNYCHKGTPVIRAVQHAKLTGGSSNLYHTETPVHFVSTADLSPCYPAPATEDTPRILEALQAKAKALYPTLVPLGRLASHRYLDMYQAMEQGRQAARCLGGLSR